jgi:lipid-A-disaccharide synthase-like uncharacterized protein
MPSTSSFLQPWLEPVFGHWLYAESGLWTVIGFLGAAIFGSRFVLQWLQTEKEKKLVVPWHFWHLSFWGSVLNLLYFMHLDKAPLILGNCFLPFLYGRNILFLRAGGEKGRGRLVFAGVVLLTVVGFGVSAFSSKKVAPEETAASEMQRVRAALKSRSPENAVLADDVRGIVRMLVADKVLNPASDHLSPEGDWLDPWGHPYRIMVAGTSAIIRCAGPNGAFDDGDNDKRDDILVQSGGPR